MAFIKCTMLIDYNSNISGNSIGRRSGGWSESYYHTAENQTIIRDHFEQLAYWRSSMLGSGAAIVGFRFQQVDPVAPSASQSVYIPGSTSLSDSPQQAVSFGVPGVGVRNVKRCVLRGVPDGNIVEGQFAGQTNFIYNLQNFLVKLAFFRFKGRDLDSATQPVLSISNVGAVVLQQPLTLAAGDYMRVLKTKDEAGRLRGGRFLVQTRTDDTHYTLAQWPHGECIGGKARKDVIIYPFIQQVSQVAIQASNRKVGRPFNQYRGRASTRR